MKSKMIFNNLPSIWAVCLLWGLGFAACTQSDDNDSGDDNSSTWSQEVSAENDAVSQWRQVLSGARLHYFHTYRSPTGGFTRVQKLDLCPQGFYNFYAEASFDMSGPQTESGAWNLQQNSGTVQLVLTPQGGQSYYFQLGMNEKQNVVIGNRVYIPGKSGKYAPQCN